MRRAIGEARESILRGQQSWAESRGIEFDSDLRTDSLEANLFQPLNAATRNELDSGAGGELGLLGDPGKLSSLRSSSALAVNFFDHWRSTDATKPGRWLGIEDAVFGLRFEGEFSTGLKGTPPHLDVVLESSTGALVGVEVKFLEPYDGVSNDFKPSYFTTPGLWDGLPQTRHAAERMAEGTLTFETLHAAQLIKHSLGLARSSDSYQLVYLWYRHLSEAGGLAEREVEEFQEMVGGELHFRSVTWDQILSGLSPLEAEHRPWLEYVGSRYGNRS